MDIAAWKRFEQIMGQAALNVFRNIGSGQDSVNIEDTPFSEWMKDPGLPNEFPIAVSIGYGGNVQGALWFIFSRKLVSRISDAFLGAPLADGAPVGADCLDAVAEAANQIAGSFNTDFRKIHGENINVQSPKTGTLTDILKSIDGTYLGSRAQLAFVFLNASRDESLVVLPDHFFAGVFEPPPPPPAPLSFTMPSAMAFPDLPPKSPQGGSRGAPPPPPAPPPASSRKNESIPNIDLIMDINLDVVLRVGTKKMPIKEIMNLSSGAVIELDKSISDPVEIRVNDKTVAYGEVVVAEGNYAIRITDIANRMERIRSLG